VGKLDVLLRHDSGRRIRVDALPEHVAFQDSGCEFATSCLRCPLERCRYETPGSSRALRQTPRDRALRQRRSEGVPIETIALEVGLSRRTVFRILAQERAA
jgi:hypothetical protein